MQIEQQIALEKMKRFPILAVRLGMLVCYIALSSCVQSQKCEHKSLDDPFLSKISCEEDFSVLKSEPLSSNYSQVDAIKIVYDLRNEQLYFIHSKQFKFHFDFCSSFLHYSKDLSSFNYFEYGDSKARMYILANLNHYNASDVYTLEFFADDKVPEMLITKLFDKVRNNVYFKEKLFILSNDNVQGKLQNISTQYIISVDDIFGNQRYQPMVVESSFGYLQKVSKKDFESFPFKKEDIILTDFLPNDIPFCQGIITNQFQTPLSHINILSQNRKTPNCAHKNAWDSEELKKFVGRLVKYEVLQDTFYVREASMEEALLYWKKRSKVTLRTLHCNQKETRLLDIQFLHTGATNTYGGKAANLGELEKIELPDHGKIQIPEAAFAIPFYYYLNHIKAKHIQEHIRLVLSADSIYNNRTRLSYHLKCIQDSIIATPINPLFYKLLLDKMKSYGTYTEFRFRSSTNAEDIDGFTGAGLYTSKTGSLVDSTKKIDKAVKKVWASLWTLRAFEERMSAHIDQNNLAMGILVHRAFGTEEANGVAITKDLYRKGYPAFTINVQKGEASVVLPKNDETPEHFLIKRTGYMSTNNDIAIDYISHSSLNNYQPLLSSSEIKLLASYLQAIKEHFYYKLNKQFEIEDINDFAMDVEFKLDKDSRKIYIKQARPY